MAQRETKRDLLREKLVLGALPYVPSLGWSEETLRAAAHDAGLEESLAWRLFPGGPSDAVRFWSRQLDARMIEALEAADLSEKGITHRVRTGVKLRLELLSDHKDAARKTWFFLRNPSQLPLCSKLVYHTVDDIWHFAGDRSTDYNFYTKRSLLAAVYTSTFHFWLKDSSPESAKTWEHLDKRLKTVLLVPTLPKKVRECGNNLRQRLNLVMDALRP